MEYHDLVKDFAYRTLANLKALRTLQSTDPGRPVFEATQLVNSMLGLLVFPQQRYLSSIPQTPIDQLPARGWPIPKVVGDYHQVSDLRQLMRYLRNSIAHFNIEFLVNESRELVGLRVWNVREVKLKGGVTKAVMNWKAELSLTDLEKIVIRFVDLILEGPEA